MGTAQKPNLFRTSCSVLFSFSVFSGDVVCSVMFWECRWVLSTDGSGRGSGCGSGPFAFGACELFSVTSVDASWGSFISVFFLLIHWGLAVQGQYHFVIAFGSQQ